MRCIYHVFVLLKIKVITQLNVGTSDKIIWDIPTCMMCVSFIVDMVGNKKERKGKRKQQGFFPFSRDLLDKACVRDKKRILFAEDWIKPIKIYIFLWQ